MGGLSNMSDADLMAAIGRQKLPRGIRNNNPGNIEDGPFARSQPGYKGSDGRFAIYETPEAGTAAKTALLGSYGRKGINTVEGVVNRWAPPTENDSGSYAQFVSQKLGVDPRAPLDMNDPRVLSELSSAIAERETGRAAAPSNVSAMSDEALMAALGGSAKRKPPPLPGQPGAVPVPQMGPGVTMERVAPYEGMKSEALGFKTEIARIADRLAPFSPANLIPGFREANAASGERLKASLERQAQQREPGKIGTFGGGVLASAALAGPTSPLVSGAISGAATGNATDLKGVLGETALGAAVGRGTALASDALQIGARKMLSKAPQIMNLEGLKKGYQEAYKAVDASGFAFPKAEIGKLVDSFEQTMASRALSKTAKEDARSIIQYARKELASGDVSVSRLEALRRDIYDAMVKKGGDAGAIGGAFRGQIDKLMDSVPNPDLKRGRELYKRWTTADFVNRASKSADRAAEQTYGGDFGRKVKDRLAPLVDEMKPTRNIRGASPDVIAGIEKVVRGSKTQNLASTLGGMTDVRRLGGKLLQGTLGAGGAAGAIGTGGASVIPSLLLQSAIAGGGAGLTATASGIARKNVNDLIKLIAAGGSKQALARVPTKTSQAVETAIARGARPALVAASVPALAAARAPNRKDGKRPNSR